MQAADIGSDKAFTGKLVKRHYKRGQQYAQLVFENRRGTYLSLSRNPKTVNSLKVGERYRVAGPEFAVGEKTFIHEPEVAPAPFHKKRLAVSFAVAFFLILTGTVFAARHFAASNKVAAQSESSNTSTGVVAQQSAVQGDSTQTANTNTPAQTTDTPPATTTTPKTTTTSVKKTTSTTPSSNSSTQNSSQTNTTLTQPTSPSSDTTTPPADTTTPPADNNTPAPDDTTKPSDNGTGTVDAPQDPTPPPTN